MEYWSVGSDHPAVHHYSNTPVLQKQSVYKAATEIYLLLEPALSKVFNPYGQTAEQMPQLCPL